MHEQQGFIEEGRTALGIELGSTRIKAVLVGPDNAVLASGADQWENTLTDGLWTYSLQDVRRGLRRTYADLAEDVARRYDTRLVRIGSVGISAMMHGYLVFDRDGRQLVPFRTWRNTSTGPASQRLSRLFGQNIPLRWSIAHLYQAILDDEPHVDQIDFMTTLAGYVHWQLTGRKVLGVGDASGMFPVDSTTGDYDENLVRRFDELVGQSAFHRGLRQILPQVLRAGEPAGELTAEGARLLDPTGTLQPNSPVCAPEGDAGTGMVATNSVAPRTGNVSVGTSAFAMVVLEHPLRRPHSEIDLVTTPDGAPVAMVHANNCTGDLDAWARLFDEVMSAAGVHESFDRRYEILLGTALNADPDGGGLLAYNFISGEPIAGLSEGRPLLTRTPHAQLSLANLMRTLLFSCFGTLRIGMDVLVHEESVTIDTLYAHGGLFRTPQVAQSILAAALQTPISVGQVAGEGGAWGMALLARYLVDRHPRENLADYLNRTVFAAAQVSTLAPKSADVAGFEAFLERFKAGLDAERAAIKALPDLPPFRDMASERASKED